MFDFETRERKTLDAPKTLHLALNHGGDLLVTVSGQCMVQVWSTEAEVKLNEFAIPTSQMTIEGRRQNTFMPTSLAVSPNGCIAAVTGSPLEPLSTWDLMSGKQLRVYDSRGADSCLAFSPCGSMLAATSGDDVLIWAIDSSKEVRKLRGHSSDVSSIDWIPESQGFLSTCQGEGNVVKAWSSGAGNYTEISRSCFNICQDADGTKVGLPPSRPGKPGSILNKVMGQ